MVDIRYVNAESISPKNLEEAIHLLPDEMISEIYRFHYHEDRRLKMMGRLLIQRYFKLKHEHFDWKDWSLDKNGKPRLNEKGHFNLSHSGNIVLAAFSEHEIGVDIEKCNDCDMVDITPYLHQKEQEYIRNTTEQKDAFYTVWTRKEAYLKAKGVGIVEGLNQENCLMPVVENTKKWYLTSLSLFQNYKVALCSQVENVAIQLQEYKLKEFYEL